MRYDENKPAFPLSPFQQQWVQKNMLNVEKAVTKYFAKRGGPDNPMYDEALAAGYFRLCQLAGKVTEENAEQRGKWVFTAIIRGIPRVFEEARLNGLPRTSAATSETLIVGNLSHDPAWVPPSGDEDTSEVRRIIAEMPADRAEVVRLHSEGIPLTEIARKMGITKYAVCKLWDQGLDMLRRRIAQD